MNDVEIARLSAGSVLKLVGIGLLCSLLPFTIIAGCTAYFGLNSLMWNGEPITGSAALFAAPFIGLFLVALFTMILGTSMAFGLWVYSFIGSIEISYRLPETARESSSRA